MGPGRRTLRDTSRVLRCCFCLPGRSSVVKQMPLCYNTGTTLTNNRRSAVRVRSPAPSKKSRNGVGSWTFCVHGSFVLRRKGSERASPKAFLRRFYQPLCGLKKPVDPPGLWAEKSLNFSAWSRRVSEFDLAILSSCREKTAVI